MKPESRDSLAELPLQGILVPLRENRSLLQELDDHLSNAPLELFRSSYHVFRSLGTNTNPMYFLYTKEKWGEFLEDFISLGEIPLNAKPPINSPFLFLGIKYVIVS